MRYEKGEARREGFIVPNITILVALGIVLVGGGIWYYTKPVTSLPAQSSPDIQDLTADWKTYRNEEYGFEVKYPSFFEVAFRDDYVTDLIALSDKIGSASDIVILPQGEHDRGLPFEDPVKSDVVLGGIRAQQLEWSHLKIIYIKDPLRNWNQHGRVEVLYENSSKDLLDQILSTFKFIEPTVDTSTWKTYRNEQYGFESGACSARGVCSSRGSSCRDHDQRVPKHDGTASERLRS